MDETDSIIPQFYTCDMCQREVFENKAALNRHIAARHSGVVPDSSDLEKLTDQLGPVYQEIFAKDTKKWRTWGEMTFRVSERRDAGARRLAEACDARRQLESVVQRWRPTARVYVFGSSVAMGLWDGLSDIDFSIIDVDALEAGEWPPNEKNAVRSVANYLRRIGFTHPYLEAIEFARVPIIKHTAPSAFTKILGEKFEGALSRSVRYLFDTLLTDEEMKEVEENLNQILLAQSQSKNINDGDENKKTPDRIWWDVVANRHTLGVTAPTTTDAVILLLSPPHTNGSPSRNPIVPVASLPLHEELRPEIFRIDFDLSFRAFGVRNSMLLRHYLNGHVCARPGALVLKDWSKSSGVNDSMHGYLTSYAVNILWIYFLLQRGLVEFKDPQSIPKNVRNVDPDPTYVPLIPADAASSPEKASALYTQMGSLLVDFFGFYTFEFDWDNHVVSLNRPGITTKELLYWDTNNETTIAPRGKNTRYELSIEDPYEDNLNLGRHIGPVRSQKFHDEFRRALLALVKGDFSDSCVFPKSAALSQQQGNNSNNNDNNKNSESLVYSETQKMSDLTKLLEVSAELFNSKNNNNKISSTNSSSSTQISEDESANNDVVAVAAASAITSDDLRRLFSEKSPEEYERIKNTMNWIQLTRALGLKCVGDIVRPFRAVSAIRTRSNGNNNAHIEQNSKNHDEKSGKVSSSSSTNQNNNSATSGNKNAARKEVDFVSLDLSDRVLATFVRDLTLERGVELLPNWMKQNTANNNNNASISAEGKGGVVGRSQVAIDNSSEAKSSTSILGAKPMSSFGMEAMVRPVMKPFWILDESRSVVATNSTCGLLVPSASSFFKPKMGSVTISKNNKMMNKSLLLNTVIRRI